MALRKKGMLDRHWNQVSKVMHIDTPIRPNDDFTFEKVIEMGLMDQVDKIVDIGETAGKEHQIENMLDSMIAVWDNIKF